MMAAEKIASDIDEAHQVLAGQASPVPTLVSTMRKLERKADSAPGLLDSAIEAMGFAVDSLSQAESELEHALRLSEFDPQELENAEERLFALRAAARKYKGPGRRAAEPRRTSCAEPCRSGRRGRTAAGFGKRIVWRSGPISKPRPIFLAKREGAAVRRLRKA